MKNGFDLTLAGDQTTLAPNKMTLADYIGPKVTDELKDDIKSFRQTLNTNKWARRLVKSTIAERV